MALHTLSLCPTPINERMAVGYLEFLKDLEKRTRANSRNTRSYSERREQIEEQHLNRMNGDGNPKRA